MEQPTDVLGKRIGAWIVDLVLWLAVTGVLFVALSDSIPRPPGVSCGSAGSDTDVQLSNCIQINDRLYAFTSSGKQNIFRLVTLVLGLAIWVVWQGLSGMTPGKALFGLRRVGADGKPRGVVMLFVHGIIGLVDLIPLFIPMLLGFIVSAVSKDKTRIADKVARTWVIDKQYLGQPPVGGMIGAGGGFNTGGGDIPPAWSPPSSSSGQGSPPSWQ